MPLPIPNHPDGLARLKQIVHDLRSPGGCPWDQEQTHVSLGSNLIEEAYETLEALQSGARAAEDGRPAGEQSEAAVESETPMLELYGTDLTVEFYDRPAVGTGAVEMLDATGRVVRTARLRRGKATLDVRALAPGTYDVRVPARRGAAVRRWVKM